MPSGRVGNFHTCIKWHYPGKKEICDINRKYGLCADMGRMSTSNPKKKSIRRPRRMLGLNELYILRGLFGKKGIPVK